MPESPKTFKCKTGECVECCTYPESMIPVSLPALYRISVYSRYVSGVNLTIPQAYDQLCSGWDYSSDPMDIKWNLPFPVSKIPCPHVDMEKKECKIHDKYQYVACRGFPEGMLLEPATGHEDNAETERFWRNLDCMRGISLTEDRSNELLNIMDLATRELQLTGNLLNPRTQPVVGKTKEAVEAELNRRMRYYDNPDIIRQLILNMHMNEIQERYMELFGIEKPDYAAGLLP